ncbi:MAG TPA: carbon storage regulator [Planctomycetaceae bacterium]|jgi:carbon storage regulator CsrA|nr:carbon storage regulator [Planctomycetaceae bacterium]
MLVLTRKVGQRIIIGDHVEVRVLGVRGKRTRLGVTAPRTVPVSRLGELLERERPMVDVHVAIPEASRLIGKQG